MPYDPLRAKSLFLAALDRDDPADRRAFLDRECPAADPELRQHVDALLAGHDRANLPFDAWPDAAAILAGPTAETIQVGPAEPGGPPRTAPADPAAAIGSTVAGRYRIVEAIGEGGMGTVYRAEQVAPIRRVVALKLIKAGMDSRTVLARFESERQALALMDHPHIARVLDAGTTDSGHPFFAMELVKGVPLTDYCDARRLGLPRRLQLFRQVCSAVQHAHQKGVIHRDLKPTNILVEDHDGTPVPKVIDFGLAKAIGGLQLGDQSLHTAFGSLTGTPLYMAPEQATFNPLDVDTRADIYALGVILYELLTGSTPIDEEVLGRAALDEVLRIVREVKPPVPSQRIGASGMLPDLAANRHVEPARLGRFLRGDLDWIVMKALSKEQDRRYESATALAQDIRRFANHEPVSAGPPTTGYRLRKFVRRHRPAVLAAALLVLTLVGGVVGTTWGLIRARDQGREAGRQHRAALAEAESRARAWQAEAVQRARAERRLVQLERAFEFVSSIFRDLDPKHVEPERRPLAAVLGERLDGALAHLEAGAIDDPLVVARLRRTLGVSQLNLGHADKAVPHLAAAREILAARLGADHHDTLATAGHLARAYGRLGQVDRAVQIDREALDAARSKLGPDHPDALAGLNNLAGAYRAAGQFDRAVALHEEALARRTARLGPDHPDTVDTTNNLANAYRDDGQAGRAIPLLERVLAAKRAAAGPDHPDTIGVMLGLAHAHRAAGQLARALPLHEEASRLARARLGPDHPDAIRALNGLAMAYQESNRAGRALPLLEESVRLSKARLGVDHPDTLASMSGLANAYRTAGRADRSLPLATAVLAARRAQLGPEHPRTLASMNDLAVDYRAAGRPAEAVALQEQALALRKAHLGPDHPETLVSMSNLANAYRSDGQLGRALALHEEALARRRAKLGPDHPDTLVSLGNLAGACRDDGQHDRAIALLEEALAASRARPGPDDPSTLDFARRLVIGHLAAGRPDRAREQLDPLLTRQHDLLGAKSTALARWLASLAREALDAGQFAFAEPLIREALPICRGKQPDQWWTFGVEAMLGASLLGQHRADEAGPHLRAGYEGMKARSSQGPLARKSALGQALDALIRWADETGKPDEAKAWREERARRAAPSAPAPGPAPDHWEPPAPPAANPS